MGDQDKIRSARARNRYNRAGFTLVEIAVISILLVIAIGSLSSAVVSTISLSRTNEETAIADDAARGMLAQLRSVPFANIFANYSANPNFDVLGLSERTDDPDGLVGQVIFPSLGGALMESVINADLGLPRDLNGDGDAVDDASGDYLVLPVTIRLDWRGVSGNRWTELDALLVE